MLLSPWNYIFLLHPARILRIMFNWSADTTEEQIGLFMRGLGPFVAIGQPGEKFASPGASRMYVSNEEWQNVVDSYLSDSQIVVLQPASTEGIWWEVERVLSSVPLERVLFCLVNFHLHQSEYEAFRRRIEPSLKKSLPTLGGLTTTPAFLFFDSDAMPHIAPTSYREPILWPVLGNAVDLATTLKPFLAGSVPASAIAHASPPKGVSERSHFAASCVYFFAIMIVLLIPFASTARNAALRAKADQVALSADSATPGDAGSKVDPSASDAPESAMTTLIRQADLHLDRKEWPAMDRVTREMLDLDSNLSTAHVYRGLYFKEVNQLPDAIRELEEATRLSPNEATLWNILGQLQLSSQLLEFAEVSFTKALEFSPDTPNFHVNRGLVRLNQEKFTPAAEDFAKALEFKFSDPGRACDLCGQAWLKAGKVMEALPYFNSAVQIVPDNADYQLHRADAFFSLGNQQFADGNASTFARGGYEEVLRLVPDFGPALFGRGMVLQRLQEHAAAIADFDKLLVREPNNDLILWRRGYSHLEAGQYERAFADFARASELDPKDQSAPELLIRIRVAQGKFDEALELCLRQLKADPTSQMLQFYNAIIRSSINPEDDEVDELRSRVSLEFLKSGDLSKVISGAMLEMVSKLTPERSQAAIEKLERQASTHPEVPLVRILQVALRIQSGELADARTQLDTIETSKLNEMAAAVLGLTKAKLMAKEIVADTTAKKTLELSDEMKAAMAWFEKQCPMHFEEGKPETLKDDWAIRVVLAKFYRDVKMLLNTIAK